MKYRQEISKSCPGRGAAPLAVRRRAGTQSFKLVSDGPGSAAHYAAQHPGNASLRPLLLAHQIGKPLEQIMGIARARRGSRVILHGKYRLAVERNSAIRTVEQRDMGLCRAL